MKLVIITPQNSSTIDEVDIVTLPGIEGAFTVLRNHAPLISAINKGDIRYNEQKIPIEKGVVEVKDDTITVITDH